MELVRLPEARDDIERLYGFLVDVNAPAAAGAIRLVQAGARTVLEQIFRPRAAQRPRSRDESRPSRVDAAARLTLSRSRVVRAAG